MHSDGFNAVLQVAGPAASSPLQGDKDGRKGRPRAITSSCFLVKIGGAGEAVVVGCCYRLSPSRQVHKPEHKHSRIRGLGFWSESTDYKILIIYLQACRGALITHVHTRAQRSY